VHNTDSVFYTFNLTHTDGTPIRGKQALEITIELARQVGDMASAFLKAPHGWVYEKTLMPFGLLQKKRYFGILYETDPNKGKPKSMGIVLRRRDNAPIVKDVYGGLIDILTKQQDLEAAIKFVRESHGQAHHHKVATLHVQEPAANCAQGAGGPHGQARSGQQAEFGRPHPLRLHP
jgi:DNA polymerase elongation subunit (family B)